MFIDSNASRGQITTPPGFEILLFTEVPGARTEILRDAEGVYMTRDIIIEVAEPGEEIDADDLVFEGLSSKRYLGEGNAERAAAAFVANSLTLEAVA